MKRFSHEHLPIILARNMADSITLKTSLLSEGEEKSAAYVKEAIMNVFLDPTINSLRQMEKKRYRVREKQRERERKREREREKKRRRGKEREREKQKQRRERNIYIYIY